VCIWTPRRPHRGARQTVVSSLPSLMNVGALLMLLCFIYAVLGVSLFGKIKNRTDGMVRRPGGRIRPGDPSGRVPVLIRASAALPALAFTAGGSVLPQHMPPCCQRPALAPAAAMPLAAPPLQGVLDDAHVNFHNFGYAMLLLIRMCTGAAPCPRGEAVQHCARCCLCELVCCAMVSSAWVQHG